MIDRLSQGVHLSRLLKGLGDLPPHRDLIVDGVQLDSRRIKPGDCFIAIEGTLTHGTSYIPQAIAAGASIILVDTKDVDRVSAESIRSVIFVNGLTEKAGLIAHRFYGDVTDVIKTLGVTGTNGKTSVSCYIAQAIDQLVSHGTCGIVGTLGQGLLGQMKPTGLTTPDVIQLHRALAELHSEGAQAVVIEASSHGLDQARLAGVNFDVALFTNLTRDHLDYHADMQAYGEAKLRLFTRAELNTAIVNCDDEFSRKIIESVHADVTVIGYSLGQAATNKRIDQLIVAEQLTASIDGIAMRIRLGEQTAVCRVPVLGRFNASNLLAALGGLIACGFEFENSVNALNKISGVAGRMELIKQANQAAVVVDFAHTPDGLEQALASLRGFCKGKLWCLIGCGGDRDRGKRKLMGSTAEAGCDQVILTSDNPRSEEPKAILDEMLGGFKQPENAISMVDRREAIAYAIKHAGKNDVILIAGKGHETWQEIKGEKFPFNDRTIAMAYLQQGASA